ncbi:MAG TPA: hypothetical protein VF575_00830 [Candidatus Saccharimonadales bacterium]|jgi:hypothetical protein
MSEELRSRDRKTNLMAIGAVIGCLCAASGLSDEVFNQGKIRHVVTDKTIEYSRDFIDQNIGSLGSPSFVLDEAVPIYIHSAVIRQS